jgi:hypothetical protein
MNVYSAGVFATLATTPLGQRLWAFVNDPQNVARMETATALERPAIEGIEEPLLQEFGTEVFGPETLDDRVKQMLGHMVRQVMEQRGYVIAVQNVKITSGAPFSRATRYKRPDDATYYVFRHPREPRTFVLTADRAGARLPAIDGGGQWAFWKSFRGELRGRIAFGLEDQASARDDIQKSGFHIFKIGRVMHAGNN